MAKKIKGSCNRCGSCCGYGGYPKCVTPYSLWKWDKQHPELGLPLIKAIKLKTGKNSVNVSNTITISGVGTTSFYLSKDGLQTSETDKTCPFYDRVGKACRIWDTQYIRPICKNMPQGLIIDSQIDKWLKDHPKCGFYWE